MRGIGELIVAGALIAFIGICSITIAAIPFAFLTLVTYATLKAMFGTP